MLKIEGKAVTLTAASPKAKARGERDRLEILGTLKIEMDLTEQEAARMTAASATIAGAILDGRRAAGSEGHNTIKIRPRLEWPIGDLTLSAHGESTLDDVHAEIVAALDTDAARVLTDGGIVPRSVTLRGVTTKGAPEIRVVDGETLLVWTAEIKAGVLEWGALLSMLGEDVTATIAPMQGELAIGDDVPSGPTLAESIAEHTGLDEGLYVDRGKLDDITRAVADELAQATEGGVTVAFGYDDHDVEINRMDDGRIRVVVEGPLVSSVFALTGEGWRNTAKHITDPAMVGGGGGGESAGTVQ